jgi:hypothetical protein
VARVASDSVGSDDSEFNEHRFDIRRRGRDGNDRYPVLDSEVTVLWILAVVRRRELTWDPFLLSVGKVFEVNSAIPERDR